MVSTDQDFTVVRGDDVQQPFTVTLDQSRTLDGSETWNFTIRKEKAGTSLATLTSTISTQISVGASTFQPTVIFGPSTLPVASFQPKEVDAEYWYDLQMTKDGLIETVAIGKITVISDITYT